MGIKAEKWPETTNQHSSKCIHPNARGAAGQLRISCLPLDPTSGLSVEKMMTKMNGLTTASGISATAYQTSPPARTLDAEPPPSYRDRHLQNLEQVITFGKIRQIKEAKWTRRR
jgi:hypothetical protein